MRNNLKEIKKIAKGIRLSSDEKSAMRGELLRYMEMHPVTFSQTIPSPFFSIQSFRKKHMLPVLIAFGLVMGGSVSFASENTLPGDILYAVKVYINEGVRGAVAVSPNAKAEWEVRLVERRLKEIEKIESNPNVSLKVKEVAHANLERYTERVNKHILKLEENEDSENAIVVSEKFTKVLRAHEATINLKVLSGSRTSATSGESREDIPTPTETRSKIKDLREKAEEKQKVLEQKYLLKVKESVRDKSDKDVRIEMKARIKPSGLDENKESTRKREHIKTEELISAPFRIPQTNF